MEEIWFWGGEGGGGDGLQWAPRRPGVGGSLSLPVGPMSLTCRSVEAGGVGKTARTWLSRSRLAGTWARFSSLNGGSSRGPEASLLT